MSGFYDSGYDDSSVLSKHITGIINCEGGAGYDGKLIGASRDGFIVVMVGVQIRTSRDRGESDLTVDCHSNSW